MKLNAQKIVTVLLAALVVVGPAASRAERRDGEHRFLEPNRTTNCRKPLALVASASEFAEYGAEEADDDDRPSPSVAFGDRLRPNGPDRPGGPSTCPGPRAPTPSAPLFLLLRHLVC